MTIFYIKMKIRAGGGALGQQGGALGQQGATPCYFSLWETLNINYNTKSGKKWSKNAQIESINERTDGQMDGCVCLLHEPKSGTRWMKRLKRKF